MTSRRLLVTGGSGFIGTNLVEHFQDAGWEVLNFDIARPRNQEQIGCWSRVDILDRAQLVRAIAQVRPYALLHFAARTDLNERRNLAGYAPNIEGVINVVEAIRATPSIGRAMFASSQLVGIPGQAVEGDEDYRPYTLYGQSKVLTERIVRVAHEVGAVWTIVRPTSIWGPWFGPPLLMFFRSIARNLYVHPAGGPIWKQWGYVGNTVFQIRRLIEAEPELVQRKTFYLADYEPVELRAFAEMVNRAFGARTIRTVPRRVLRAAAIAGDVAKKLRWADPPLSTFRYENIVRNEIQDLSSVRRLTGDLPYPASEGIDMTVRWMRGHVTRLRG